PPASPLLPYTTLFRSEQSEHEVDDDDHAEVHRVHAELRRDRQQDRDGDDQGGDGFQHTADEKQYGADQEQEHGGVVGETQHEGGDVLRNALACQHPAQQPGGGQDEGDRGCGGRGLHGDAPQRAQGEPTITKAQDNDVGNTDSSSFGGGEQPAEDPPEKQHGCTQRPDHAQCGGAELARAGRSSRQLRLLTAPEEHGESQSGGAEDSRDHGGGGP